MPVTRVPVETFKLRMPSEQPEGTRTLKAFYDNCYGQFRRCRNKKMDMVIQPNFDMLNGKAVLIGNIVKDLFYLIFESWSHPFIAILRSPDDVIVNIVDAGSTMCIF